MVYEEVTRLAGDKAALLVFLRAVGQGILTPLPAPPAGAAAAAGTPAEAPAPGPVPASPFAEATSPGAAAAAAAVAAATMAAAEGGVPEAASTLEAPLVPKEEPAQLPVGGGLSLPGALENASSLNFGSSLSLDNLLGAMAAQAETPNPVGLLGPM